MKKSVKFLALVVTLVMLCTLLASCGKTLSGKYSMEEFGTGTTYEFSGKNVSITIKVLGAQVGDAIEGTYSIDDDQITFTFEGEDSEEYSGTFDFEEGEDYIKIGEIGKLTKED